MIEQSRIDEMTEARTARGDKLYVQVVGPISMDWQHYAECRDRLSSSEKAEFDLAFVKARQIAGVRASVDLALAEMRRKMMNRLGKPSWRAG